MDFAVDLEALTGDIAAGAVSNLIPYAVQAGNLDERYLDRWAIRLGVSDALARIRAPAS